MGAEREKGWGETDIQRGEEGGINTRCRRKKWLPRRGVSERQGEGRERERERYNDTHKKKGGGASGEGEAGGGGVEGEKNIQEDDEERNGFRNWGRGGGGGRHTHTHSLSLSLSLSLTHSLTQRRRRKGGLQTRVAWSGRYSLASRERGERDGVSRPGGLLQRGAGRGAVSRCHVPIDCSERRLGAGQEAELSFGHPRRHGRLVAGLIAAGRLLCRSLLSLRLRCL